MKVVILAGGLGTRISEESHLKPKPMIEIGGRPILWHIMKIYSYYGINDFVICLGYGGYIIKEYFANYFLHMSDVTFDVQKNRMEVHQRYVEPWRVTLVDTGQDTLTGGRLKRVRDYIAGERFCFTYGDGVSDLNIKAIAKFENTAPKLAIWMEEDLHEGLVVFAFDPAHRLRLRTSNMSEPLNEEIKRRTCVATLFPNEKSLLRLVTAVVGEIDDEWTTAKIYLTMKP